MCKQLLVALMFCSLALVGSARALAGAGVCHFDSDCGPHVKCNSGKCATAAGSACHFDSDCGGVGAKCNSGKCSNAPDGTCYFDSECAGTGKCASGGKCRK
jgi:hypothetical protein